MHKKIPIALISLWSSSWWDVLPHEDCGPEHCYSNIYIPTASSKSLFRQFKLICHLDSDQTTELNLIMLMQVVVEILPWKFKLAFRLGISIDINLWWSLQMNRSYRTAKPHLLGHEYHWWKSQTNINQPNVASPCRTSSATQLKPCM